MIEEEIIGPQPEEVEESLEAKLKQRLELLAKIKPYWRRFLIGFLGFIIFFGAVYAFRQIQWELIFPRPGPTPTPTLVILPSPTPTPFKLMKKLKPPFVFRIDEEEEITRVVMIDEEGQERMLREYQAETGPARKLYPSSNDKFLAISLGTGMLGSLEIIDLETEETVETLEEYGKVIWFDEQRLVLNVPEEVEPPRPYEEGDGVSLATFDAVLGEYNFLKQADTNTDYVLVKIVNEEIFFEVVVASDPDWKDFTTSRWRINFEGTLEEEVSQ